MGIRLKGRKSVGASLKKGVKLGRQSIKPKPRTNRRENMVRTAETLDDILKYGQDKLGLDVVSENVEELKHFGIYFASKGFPLDDGRRTSPQGPYFYLTVDAFVYRSYFMGKREIRDSRMDSIYLDGNRDQLPLLRSRGDSSSLWDDTRLYSLANGRNRAKILHPEMPDHIEMIDLIGSYGSIVERWGGIIVHDRDMRIGHAGKRRKR